MCRGLAVCFNWKDGFYTKGVSSHSDTCKNKDDFNLEIMIDDNQACGYCVEVDEQYFHGKKLDEIVYSYHKDKICLTGKFKKDFKKLLDDWISENEISILRGLLCNQTYQKHKEDQFMCFCKADKSQFMRSCEAGGDQDMSSCKVGKSQYMNSCEASESQYMSFCKAGEDQVMSYCSCGGNRFVSYMTGKDESVNAFIKDLSDEQHGSLTWDFLVRLAMKGYKKEG